MSGSRSVSQKRRKLPWWVLLVLLVVGVPVWILVIEPFVTTIGFTKPGDCVQRVGTMNTGERLKVVPCDAGDMTYTVTKVGQTSLSEERECPAAEVSWSVFDRPNPRLDPPERGPFACLAPNLHVGECYRAYGTPPEPLGGFHGTFPCDDARGAGFFEVVDEHPKADAACSPGSHPLSHPRPGRTYCVKPLLA